jgi:hypothetical protein
MTTLCSVFYIHCSFVCSFEFCSPSSRRRTAAAIVGNLIWPPPPDSQSSYEEYQVAARENERMTTFYCIQSLNSFAGELSAVERTIISGVGGGVDLVGELSVYTLVLSYTWMVKEIANRKYVRSCKTFFSKTLPGRTPSSRRRMASISWALKGSPTLVPLYLVRVRFSLSLHVPFYLFMFLSISLCSSLSLYVPLYLFMFLSISLCSSLSI